MRPLAGRYALGQVLGTGGTSVVLSGHDLVLDRDVAVKILAAGHAADPILRRRMQAGATCAARLDHPNIGRVYDFGAGRLPGRGRVEYLVVELLNGCTLADRLMGDPMGWRAAVRVCALISAGLAAAHRVGVVHRDIKPTNVMLASNGVKVIDFGFAAFVGETAADPAGLVLGTREYLAPERWLGMSAGTATDVYGLGLTLYQCLAGSLPWPGRVGSDLMSARCYIPPDPLPAIKGLPAAVTELLFGCLAADPADRPTSAVALDTLASASGCRPIVGRKALAEAGARVGRDRPVLRTMT